MQPAVSCPEDPELTMLLYVCCSGLKMLSGTFW